MDPALVAMFLTIGGGILLRMLERVFKASNKKVDYMIESALAPKSLNEPDYYNCEASTERMFEQRFVEAEIMGLEDMTMCEDYECKNCQPSRDRIRAIHRAKQREEAEERNATLTHRERFESMLDAQGARAPIMPRPPVMPRPPAGNGGGSPSPNQLREKELQEKQYRHVRYTTLFGRQFPIPNNVPKRAEAIVIPYTHEVEINWTWLEDGRPMVIKQHVDRRTLNELPRTYAAKSYEIGAIKELGEIGPIGEVCPIEIDQLLDAPGYIHHHPLEKPRRAPRIGTETYKK